MTEKLGVTEKEPAFGQKTPELKVRSMFQFNRRRRFKIITKYKSKVYKESKEI